ncbi:MAG: TonB-dependent receptor plug domain-containing protein, partial [Gemmatimonadaceae bacterium]
MRMRCLSLLVRVSLVVTAVSSANRAVSAQTPGSQMLPPSLLPGQLAERGPRFLLDRGSTLVPLDVARTPVLKRLLSLDLAGVSTREALKSIARQAGFELLFSDQIVPHARRVQLRASGISVAAALTDVLLEAGVDIVFTRSGSAALVRRPPAQAMPAAGTITGRVTDATTGLGVPGAQLLVAETELSRVSDDDGRYTIPGVPAGVRRLSVRRLGYQAEAREVTVSDGESITADFTLAPAATRLTEVVTTVTGDQRRLELGNALARVQADSIAANAQVRNLPELISGRAPGVLVFFPNGLVGQAPRIRIRGTNSLTVRNDPLVIVDGARVDNSPAVFSTYSLQSIFAVTPQSGRLSDLNPDEIESIEIVKGPSAATLYGTDAANGVVVVTTKRGRPGPTRWTIQSDFGIVQPRGNWAPNYYSWGRTTTGTPVQCTIVALAARTCTVDSLTRFNPLKDAPNAPFANGNLQKLGIQASGGSTRLGYFVGGEYNRELGVLQLSAHEETFLKQSRGVSSIPDEQLHPNFAERLNLRGNVNAQLGGTADLSVNAGLVRNSTRIPRDGLVLDGAVFGRGTADTLEQ